MWLVTWETSMRGKLNGEGLRSAALLKAKLQYRCFPVNSAKFLLLLNFSELWQLFTSRSVLLINHLLIPEQWEWRKYWMRNSYDETCILHDFWCKHFQVNIVRSRRECNLCEKHASATNSIRQRSLKSNNFTCW